MRWGALWCEAPCVWAPCVWAPCAWAPCVLDTFRADNIFANCIGAPWIEHKEKTQAIFEFIEVIPSMDTLNGPTQWTPQWTPQ